MRAPSIVTGTLRKHPFRDYAALCVARIVDEGRRAPAGHVMQRTFDGRAGVFYEAPVIPVPSLPPGEAMANAIRIYHEVASGSRGGAW